MRLLLLAVAIASTANAVVFDCVYTKSGDNETCNATVTNMGVPKLTGITGADEEPQRDAVHAWGLVIQGQNLTFFPKDIGAFFHRLKAINVTNVTFTSISAGDLEGLSKLEYLTMTGVELTTLNGNLFKFTPNLKEIRIFSNPLAHIGKNLVKNLVALNVLWIKGNCGQLFADSRATIDLFAPTLFANCPLVEETGTTTSRPTTIASCVCDGKIENLKSEIKQLKDHANAEIEKLQAKIEKLKDHENAEIGKLQLKTADQKMEIDNLSAEVKAFKKRMNAVEKHQSCASSCLA